MSFTGSIDEALERFEDIVREVDEENASTPLNESTTRLQLIDPILIEVLGWPRSTVETELYAGAERLDYRLRTEDHTWIVIEAKKRQVELVRSTGQTRERFKLDGAVIRGECWNIIARQMPPYLGRYNPDYGVVTNGRQWVGFLHRAKVSGRDLSDDYGVVFRSLDDIRERFEEFYNYFSVEGVRGGYLHRVLEPHVERGLVRGSGAEPIIGYDEVKSLSYQDREDFYAQLQVAVEQAFKTIHEDEDALAQCFVESRESMEADSRLERCAQLLQETLDDATQGYKKVIEGELEGFSGRLEETDELEGDLRGKGDFVRLTGEESSGKTVFLKRFYGHQLSRQIRENIVLLWIDGTEIPEATVEALANGLLEQVKRQLFSPVGPDINQFKDLYIQEWGRFARRRGLDTSKTVGSEHWEAFVGQREIFEREQPFEALVVHLWYVVRNRQRLPCIVYDGIDTRVAATAYVQFAVSLHRNVFAFSTISLRDRTLWRLREERAYRVEGLSPISLWLPRPKVREVIEHRIDYLRHMLEQEESAGHRAVTRVGRSRGIRWDVDPERLARAVSEVLLTDSKISNWLGLFCNYNLRGVLDLCRQIILSPHVKTEDLLEAQVLEGASVSPSKVLRALISPNHVHFVPQADTDIIDVFGTWSDDDWAPLLPFRMLVYLRSRKRADRSRRVPVPGFVSIERILGLFSEHLRMPEAVVRAQLQQFLTRGLIETEQPHHTRLQDDTVKIAITHRGEVHIDWACEESQYVQMMAEVEPIVGRERLRQLQSTHHELIGAFGEGRWSDIQQAVHELVGVYIRYVCDTADQVAKLPYIDEFEAVAKVESELRGQWLGTS